jgi:polar amino acid transport system permease protein
MASVDVGLRTTDSFISGKPAPLGAARRYIITAVIVVLFIALIARILLSNAFTWPVVWQYLWHPAILDGLVMTLWLTALSMLIGTTGGAALAVMAIARFPAIKAASVLYVWVFRGTPLLVQLIFWFNIALVFPAVGFGDWTVPTNTIITPFGAALLGLGLNEAAYMAEIIRAGIASVDEGQSEAAYSVGMSRGQTLRYIVFPQAMQVIIPPTANQAIGMLKNTSLVSVIGAQELLTRTQDIYARNFQVIELLTVASIWYLIMTTLASGVQYWLERKLGAWSARSASIKMETPA